ncbi:MAG: phospholipid carrier-dependent glycosyltransferase [Ignavibacteriaceae bacterium]|nr:phospholipid carrier-dependent glycosyltransferase [Ignavibacteriaceae bacterium]
MSPNIKRNLPYYFAVTAIIVLYFTVEINLLNRGFYALSADESGHTIEAYNWYKGDGQIFSIWLPFHKIVNGAALNFYFDLIITPRLVSLLFGFFTVIVMILIAYQLFDNLIIALLTGFLSTIFLPIAVFSVLPLIEIFYFFFVVAAIFFLLLWSKSKKASYLWLTASCLAIATTTRYEAWIFTFVVFLVIAYKIFKDQYEFSKSIILLLPIFVIISIFPISWVILSLGANKGSQDFISAVTARYNEGRLIAEIKNNVVSQFIEINLSSLNIIGIASLLYLFKHNESIKKFSGILFSTLLIFSLSSFFIKAMPTHNYWRIGMIWCLMLLPFTAHLLFYFLENAKSNVLYKYVFAVFFFVIIYSFTSQLNKYTQTSYLTVSEISLGNYLNKLSNNKDACILIMKDGSDKWRYANILVASQNPEIFLDKLRSLEYVNTDTVYLTGQLVEEIKQNNLSYFLSPVRTTLIDTANRITKLKSCENWNVFKINPK